MEVIILIFKYFFLFFFLFYNMELFAKEAIQGKAVIIDGDTINIGNNKIRLHGIDAPEIKQACSINNEIWKCGVKSTQELKKLINGQNVYCEIVDLDQYRRLIGICYVETENINRFMVKNGWAIAYRYYSEDYVVDEEIAKKNKLGIWKGQFEEPYLFRKNKK